MGSVLLRRSLCVAMGLLLVNGVAAAQTGNGTLSGTITDPDGVALPGATVSAESEALLGERVAHTDAVGGFRLVNLPPGAYTIVAELAGFQTVRRENISMRAGADFRVDVTMELAGVQSTITVTAETPMIDLTKSGQVLTIDGDFQRAIPVQSRKNWSDFLELTPGVHARPFDDGSGRMVYFGHGTEHFAHVIQLEGQRADNYRDAQPTYVQMSTDMIADIEVRSSGQEAASPIGTGLVMNIVTKSGGNEFHGSASWQIQPLDWNGNNDPGGINPSTPTIQKVNQLDFGLGGPIVRSRAWFFANVRVANNEAGISRTGEEVARLQAWSAAWEPFNNVYSGVFPYAKVTAQLTQDHQFSGYYQFDRTNYTNEREYHTGLQPELKTGGNLFGGKVTSLWDENLTSEFLVSYNDKTSSYTNPEDILGIDGPQGELHADSFVQGGRRVGTGRLLANDVDAINTIGPSSILMFRGDVTWYKPDLGGSHEFQTGFFLGFYHRESNTHYGNDGFTTEFQQLFDPNDLSSEPIPYYRIVYSPTFLSTNNQDDRDLGIYFQDTWQPTNRLTLSLGLRADFIRRYDNLFDLERMNDLALGPRIGATYMLTDDGRNVLRGSYTRVHEQVGGRDYASSTSGGGRVDRWQYYDLDLDGDFETEFFRAAIEPSIAQYEFDPDLHQPWVDEFVVGYGRQFTGEITFDVAFMRREQKHRYGQVDVNGYYPENPGEPFIGFGRIDNDRGILQQLTNNTWDKLVYNAIEVTVARRMRNNWQFLASFNRQWHKQDGTWNPTDPARFIQPGAYPNSRCLWRPRGNDDDNSLGTGGTSTYCPTWRDYSLRFGGTYSGPYGIIVTGNFTLQAGPWSGPILERLPAGDPAFGPPTVTNPITGNVETNPLSTRVRFKFDTRNEGQEKLPNPMYLNFRVGKEFTITGDHRVEVAVDMFNLLNWSNFQQYTYNGANETWNPNYLAGRSMQAARVFQVVLNYRF